MAGLIGRQFSSVVEQLIRNEQVVGSSPTTGSIFRLQSLAVPTVFSTIPQTGISLTQ